MGICILKKKLKENLEYLEMEDVWKKWLEELVLFLIEIGLYNFRREDLLIIELKVVFLCRNENVNILFYVKGIKMVDDFFFGSYGFVMLLLILLVRRV